MNVSQAIRKSASCAGPICPVENGVTHRIAISAFGGWPALIPGGRRLARSLAMFGPVAASSGCILTKDLPDPAPTYPRVTQARSSAPRTRRRRSTGGVVFVRGADGPDGGGADRQSDIARPPRGSGRPMRRREHGAALLPSPTAMVRKPIPHLRLQLAFDQWRPRSG